MTYIDKNRKEQHYEDLLGCNEDVSHVLAELRVSIIQSLVY